MSAAVFRPWRPFLLVLATFSALATGCQSLVAPRQPLVSGQIPTDGVPSELSMVSLPAYRVEPPDILLIDAVKIIPKSPHRVESFDILQILVDGALPEQPIANNYQVEPGGTINLGPAYGRVSVAGLTIDEATEAIDQHLRMVLTEPQVSVSLTQSAGVQQIAGEHLVGPDGTVNLGTYGSVRVAGMSLVEAKAAIEAHLAEFLDEPEVAVDVFAYNSKVYYIITESTGVGDQVVRVPVTGNETVLDAVAQINGLSQISSKQIWISRPTPGGTGCEQVLPVNWMAITRGASSTTNYQVLPGDRVFIAEHPLSGWDANIQRLLTPFERLFGSALLGTQTIQTINRFPKGLSTRS